MGKSSVSDLSEHVFDLIQELFTIDPMLLTSVMPQLEFKLKVNITHTLTQFSSTITLDHRAYVSVAASLKYYIRVRIFFKVLSLQSNDGEERLAVVRLLAKLFGAKDSELASQNRPLWQCFLGR